ncbi:MAG: hypothetical protein ACLFN1_09705 [Bacteroidales bacterium]
MNFPVSTDWDYSTSDVPVRFENSERFARYSMMASLFDFELVGGHFFFYDDPVMYLTKEVDPQTIQLTGLTVRPGYHHVSMGGGSFSIPLGGFVLRGEGVINI